jgi:catechol 2,3-dioxygenase-like lactoylglutathione lyase family enzyme
MADSIPTLSHVSLGTSDFARAKAFYDAVLATLQMKCIAEFPGGGGYGRRFPDFWIQSPHDGGPASAGNGVHVCFFAASRQEVQAFHARALELGASDDGAPGPRPEYSATYYAGFVKDLDGNKIEAMVFGQ